jgi:hypothetical protein
LRALALHRIRDTPPKSGRVHRSFRIIVPIVMAGSAKVNAAATIAKGLLPQS